MKPLPFLCPRTGDEVDAGIDIDGKSFASLIRVRDTKELSCPDCPELHVLAGVSAWLGELHKSLNSVVDGRVMGEPRTSQFLADFLCFVFMFAAVAAMSEMDFGSPLNLLAELGNGE
jgi:hypothetical protein